MIPETNSSISFNQFPANNGNINDDKNFSANNKIFKLLTPLSFPYQDKENRLIQLWKTPRHSLVGTMVSNDGRLTIIPEKRIYNALNASENPKNLIIRLESFALRTWDLVFDPRRIDLTIWPQLIAAGKYFEKRSGVIQDWIDGQKKHIKHNDLNAARRELKGEEVKLKDNGVPFNHVHEVTDAQNGLFRAVNALKRELSTNKLTPEERKQFEKQLSEASRLLDHTETSVPPAIRQFHQLLQQTKLTKSYNSTHQDNPVPAKGDAGQIGGVACSVDYIQGLFDSPEALFEDEHLFCLPELSDGQLPFTDHDLRQILRELAIGIYVHSTVPFFSLHFKEGTLDLFPVIHPAYENTLVGRVISMLDYIMKGYLNGGVYSEDFVDNWYKDPNWNKKSASALEHLTDFYSYCEKKFNGNDKHYVSVRNVQDNFQIFNPLDDEPEILKNFTGFKNSFRIIAKQNSFPKHGNLLLMDSDFDVRYTIEPSPEYKEELAKYTRKHGCLPPSYQKLEQSYKLISKQIHDHMVKMPLCRQYFSMLGIINFFSSYFSTLKKHRKIPVLPALETTSIKGCPPLFPHLPIVKTNEEVLKINPSQVINEIFQNRTLFKKYVTIVYLKCIDNRYQQLNPEEVELELYQGFLTIFSKKIEWNAYKFYSSSFLNYLKGKREDFTTIFKDTAIGFLNVLFEDLKKLMQDLRSQVSYYNYKKLMEDDLVSNVLDQFLDQYQKRWLNKNIDIRKVPYPVSRLVSDLGKHEFESNRKVVGGCGMELTQQTVVSSKKAEDVLVGNWSKLENLKPESWKKIRLGDSKGAAFKLVFEDVPVDLADNYQWMESLLLIPKDTTPEMIENRIKIEQAISDHNKDEFKKLINEIPHLNKLQDRQGRTLMHHASAQKDPEYAQLLLNKGLSFKVEDIHGFLPIHYSAMHGSEKTVQLFIAKDKNLLNAVSKNGSTPLVVSIQHHQLAVVNLLLPLKPALCSIAGGYTELHSALHEGNDEIIKKIVEDDRIIQACLNICNQDAGTPLMMACELNTVLWVETLLKKGANPESKRADGMTALEIAVRHDCVEIVKVLLQKAILTPSVIEAASQEGSLEILYLLEKNLGFTAFQNSCKDTPLHIALRHGNIPIALYLTKYATEFNKSNIEGQTPVSLAIEMGAWEVLWQLFLKKIPVEPELLLRVPYHPTIKKILDTLKSSQETLQRYLFVAAEAGNYLTISLALEPKGAKLEELQGPNGWRLLHYLAKCDGIHLFKRLIIKTKDIMQPLVQEGNKTLAYIAAENGSFRVLSFLLEQMKIKNIPLEKHYKDRHLFYPILETGDQKSIEMMLNIFSDRNLANEILDEQGSRPVHLAAKMGLEKVLMLLEEKGADLKVYANRRLSVLFNAMHTHDEKCIRYLLKNQVEINIQDLAVAEENDKLFQLLIQAQPDQFSLDAALFNAAAQNRLLTFTRLLEKGANFNFIFDNNYSAFLIAAYRGNQDFLELMLQHAPFDQDFFEGNNALHLACENGHGHCVKLLLNAGFEDEPNKVWVTTKELAQDYKGVLLILNDKREVYDRLVKEFVEAIDEDSPKKMKAILEQLSLSETLLIEYANQRVWGPPLHLMARFGKKQIKELVLNLLMNQPNPNSIDSEGNALTHLLIKSDIIPIQHPEMQWNFANYLGQTPLHIAAAHASVKTLQELLGVLRPTLVNFADNKGRTPLMYAIQSNQPEQIEILKLLIENGADIEQSDYQLVTPLILACKMKLLYVVKLLIQKGANPNRPGTLERVVPLMISIQQDQKEITRWLLLHGANCHHLNINGLHVMHLAALRGDTQLFNLLAAKGVSTDVRDDADIEPKHIAASVGEIPILENILKRRPDAIHDPFELQEATPLHVAAQSGQTYTVDWLLQHRGYTEVKADGLDILAFASAGRASKAVLEKFSPYRISKNHESLPQALKQAIIHDNLDAVMTLHKWGALLNIPIEEDYNALHFASIYGSVQCTAWLLQNGANPAFIGNLKETAFDLSAANKSYEQFRILLEFADPDLEQSNDRGQTLLHIASKAGNLKHMMLLILNGASLNTKDAYGFTPLHMAVEGKHLEVVKMLLACGADHTIRAWTDKLAFEMLTENEENIRNVFLKHAELLEKAEKNESRLHQAIKSNYPLAVKLLAQLDDVNHKNAQGMTPLHLAVQLRQISSILHLLKENAELDCVDQEGKTPLWYACLRVQDPKIAKLLVKAGANAQHKDASNLSILKQIKKANIPNKEMLIKILTPKKMNK